MWFLLFAFVPWAESVVISMNYEQPERCVSASCPFGSHSRCRPSPRCPTSANGRCRSGWTYYKNTNACYKTFLWATFDDAERRCESYGGHLTSIHSDDENDFVVEMAETGYKWTEYDMLTWIGLRQADYPQSKKWTWTDGTNVDFIPWAPTEPNNKNGIEHCAQAYTDHGPNSGNSEDLYRKWNDVRCNYTMKSYCARKWRSTRELDCI